MNIDPSPSTRTDPHRPVLGSVGHNYAYEHLPLDHWTAHSWILRCLLGYFRLPRLWLSPCSRLVEFNQLHGNICTMDPLLTIATSPWSVATHVTPSRGVIMLTQQVLGAFESDVASLLLLFY
jgi:hypothetical protein